MYVKEYRVAELDSEITQMWDSAIKALQCAGAKIRVRVTTGGN